MPLCPCSSLECEENTLVTSRLGSCSSAMPNSPAFFLPFCLLALLSSTSADVGSMIDRAVSSSQDKTQENISRLWTLHESHFWLWRWGRHANTEVICQRRRIKGTLHKTSNRLSFFVVFSLKATEKKSDLTIALTKSVAYRAGRDKQVNLQNKSHAAPLVSFKRSSVRFTPRSLQQTLWRHKTQKHGFITCNFSHNLSL